MQGLGPSLLLAGCTCCSQASCYRVTKRAINSSPPQDCCSSLQLGMVSQAQRSVTLIQQLRVLLVDVMPEFLNRYQGWRTRPRRRAGCLWLSTDKIWTELPCMNFCWACGWTSGGFFFSDHQAPLQRCMRMK